MGLARGNKSYGESTLVLTRLKARCLRHAKRLQEVIIERVVTLQVRICRRGLNDSEVRSTGCAFVLVSVGIQVQDSADLPERAFDCCNPVLENASRDLLNCLELGFRQFRDSAVRSSRSSMACYVTSEPLSARDGFASVSKERLLKFRGQDRLYTSPPVFKQLLKNGIPTGP